MNKNVLLAKNYIKRRKRAYKILLSFMIISIIIGIFFYFLISVKDKTVVVNSIKNFFAEVNKGDNLNYGSSLINSLLVNIGYVLSIWFLGISVIGLPLIILIMFYKCFITGFSISAIISIYGFKGILGAFVYTFPHDFLFLVVLLLLEMYSISFSLRLFNYLFRKKIINFKDIMNKYIKILVISLVSAIVLAFIEVFVSTYFIKLFTFLIK